MVDRIFAKPRTKNYNSFSIVMQKYLNIKRLLEISKNNFNPAPEIDSTFISLIKKDIEYNEDYNKFVKECFLMKRRTLLNNLKKKDYYDKVVEFIKYKGFSMTIRAEELTISDFDELYSRISR